MSYSNDKTYNGLKIGNWSTRASTVFSATKRMEKSWLSECRVCDDQGQTDGCVIWTFGSYAEVVYRRSISNTERLAVYRTALKRLGRTSGGLTFDEGFQFAQEAGWLPDAKGIDFAELNEIQEAPLLGGFKVTPAFNTNAAGCFDHGAPDWDQGLHAMLVVALGTLSNVSQDWFVYVENSWPNWGWNGIGFMNEGLHSRLNQLLIKVIR